MAGFLLRRTPAATPSLSPGNTLCCAPLHSAATTPPLADAWGMFSIFATKTDTAAEEPDALSCVDGTFCEGTGEGALSLGLNSTHLGMAQARSHYFYGTFSVGQAQAHRVDWGTLLAFYLVAPGSSSNKDVNHSEVDMELYGSENGRQVVFATSLFTGASRTSPRGTQTSTLAHAHTFTIQWNSRFICWYVNGVPHRVLYRDWDKPWPARPMKAVDSLWDTSSFTTLKSNYILGPVTALVQGYSSQGCAVPDEKVLDPDHEPGSCPTWNDPNLPWNAPLSVAAAMNVAASRRHRLISDFGWDKA